MNRRASDIGRGRKRELAACLREEMAQPRTSALGTIAQIMSRNSAGTASRALHPSSRRILGLRMAPATPLKIRLWQYVPAALRAGAAVAPVAQPVHPP